MCALVKAAVAAFLGTQNGGLCMPNFLRVRGEEVCGFSADRFWFVFARTYPDALGQIQDKNFTVTDIGGSCSTDNSVNCRLYKILIYSNLDLGFREQVNFHHLVTKTFGISFLLSAEPLTWETLIL